MLFAAAMQDLMFECFTKLRIPTNNATNSSNNSGGDGNGRGFASSVCLVREKVVALLSGFLWRKFEEVRWSHLPNYFPTYLSS